jgi:hypothetical protein
MRNPLEKTLRHQLERAVEKARQTAEIAAKEVLQQLAVGDQYAPDYLSSEQRDLRKRLRAHSRFLGDIRKGDGSHEVTFLISEIAYQHWHRMLFSRFLAENNLLIYEDGVTPLAISDCFDLAEEETGDSSNGWKYAANFAAQMLPQIFRNDSPIYEIEFAPNHQKELEKLLEGLDVATFHSQDALGWVYQFWQSKRKEEVNASEVKIGAKELSPVTQLFTEPYMVSFLLDNALGAWWANQQLTENDYATAHSEEELRKKASLDGVPLEYLRFIRTYTDAQQTLLDSDDAPDEKLDPEGIWEPAAGKFEKWPEDLADFKALDPCCGSGHFLVAVFLMLVPIRMEREDLTEQQAIDLILSQNIHGLELDQRCVEIAVFALALEAWRYPNGGGYRLLPELHLACSGVSVKAAKEEWKQLGLGSKNLTIALDWLYKEFGDAPVLGSLLNPAKSDAANIISWDDLSATLSDALKQETREPGYDDETQRNLEATVVAQGMAKAATMLADQYYWVVTNVPYLGRGLQNDTLKDFIGKRYPAGKSDLATAFLDRCLEFCVEGGSSSVVLPQNWLFLTSYKKFREKLLTQNTWNMVARLGGGAEAFENGPGNITNIAMISLSHGNSEAEQHGLFVENTAAHYLRGVDVSEARSASDKAVQLTDCEVKSVGQAKQLENPDSRISFELRSNLPLLNTHVDPYQGLRAGDKERFVKYLWEIFDYAKKWDTLQTSSKNSWEYDGVSQVIMWEKGAGQLAEYAKLNRAQLHDMHESGNLAWGSKGIAVNQMGALKASRYTGYKFDGNLNVLVLKETTHLPAIWAFCRSTEFHYEIRKIDQKISLTNATLGKIPFDLESWQKVADEQYPNGLPQPYTNDPTQWIFHGHPCGSVIWDEESKWTAKSDLRIDDTVLQIALARLLGYQWPAELDPYMELAGEQREWVEEVKSLSSFVDDDGIVCLPAVRGEKAADQRLEELLQAAYGETWSTQTRNKLLEAVGCKNKSLDNWLREKFFEQHCKLFQHRPFIWHVWDGLHDGFSALVNYHLLTKKNMERLIYTYLDDWIRSQSHQQAEGIDGAAERLRAAEILKERLVLILEGEAPYDIFVRWKPIEDQSVGWNPDLNDGVRLNIRPFMTVSDVGKKDAGILRTKPNIHWKKDRGKDVESAPWYSLGPEYEGKEGDRINDHHLSLEQKNGN